MAREMDRNLLKILAGIAKPPIKKIVWDASETSTSLVPTTTGVSAIGTVVGGTVSVPAIPQQQPLRRAHGLRRGGPSRARGAAQYWPQGSPARGAQYSTRARGGRGFRGY
uniref:Uncharacterized protein n=1 Tax=Arion vulgaris TaxID=1028688 RepID=A0A0B7BC24_9EUPU